MSVRDEICRLLAEAGDAQDPYKNRRPAGSSFPVGVEHEGHN